MHSTDTLTFSSARGTRTVDDVGRWASFATATAMLAYGLSRRTRSGMWLAAVAVPFAYRGIVGDWPTRNARASRGDARTALAGERGIHVRESIRLELPIGDVYRFWRKLENLPRFMSYLERVTELDDKRSHWVAKGPGNVGVEWDAEIINDVENKVIAWRSLPDSQIVTAGSVNFATARAGRSTQLAVHLQYLPPAGRAGALVATLTGREPSQTIREDLRRVKQLLETGEVAQAAPSR